jgi:hypothetical protein
MGPVKALACAAAIVIALCASAFAQPGGSVGGPVSDDEAWISIGPYGIGIANNDVISGQVNAVAVHPTDANTLYIGASEGGVWKTTNGGGSWTPLTDFQLTRLFPGKRKGTTSIGSLAIDPTNPNIVYAGTGDPNVASFISGAGIGVFRSADAGLTWAPTGATLDAPNCQNNAIGQIVVNRLLVRAGNPNTGFAATSDGLFAYREDGGDCWTRLLGGLPADGRAIDLVVDNEGSLYVAFWSKGIFRSDRSNTEVWTKLTQGLPNSGFGRIALAFAGRRGPPPLSPASHFTGTNILSSPSLYAGFNAGRYRLFHTANRGDTWTELPSPPSDGQLDFNNALAVSPHSGDEVYVGQIAMWRAVDGGRAGGLNNFKVTPTISNKSWSEISCCYWDANQSRQGMDVHADAHDIVFAPAGSFVPSATQARMFFVANDGGVTKGVIDSRGVVTWTPLTNGLAIGQCGSLGLNPNNTFESTCGLWHNGNVLLDSSAGLAAAFGGGDGFNTTVDAAPMPTTVYENCNAGFDGSICRDVRGPSGFFTQSRIWTAQNGQPSKHFSDPYRPGHLFVLETGRLSRTTAANTASESDLINGPHAWAPIEPPGKTGNTTTMAFRSWVLEEQPVYYLGTDTGQVWRGSPEVGWAKLCECGAQVNGIGPDLFVNERIYVVLKGSLSPGRIKRLSRQGGQWTQESIDDGFNPAVNTLTSVAANPVPTQFVKATTVYVGTDQGLYRGRLKQNGWDWVRAKGFPPVYVTEVKAHQSARFYDLTQIVRASTYGRGIYELRRSPGGTLELPRLAKVEALRVFRDGAPQAIGVDIQVETPRERTKKQTPFELAPHPGFDVVHLQAPVEIRDHNAVLGFDGWAIDGKGDRRSKIAVKLADLARVVVYYSLRKRLPPEHGGPVKASLKATAQAVCTPDLSHQLAFSWEILGGGHENSRRARLTYPDKSGEIWELKHFIGVREIPINFPMGGAVAIQVTVGEGSTDAVYEQSAGIAAASAEVKLDACSARKQAH